MSQTVLVESVLWAGGHGGAIFRGTAGDGDSYRFVAGAEVMPRSPLQGEVWSISGVCRKHVDHGYQVNVSSCVLQRPSGRLIIKALAESRAFPGIGAVTARKLWAEYGDRIYDLLDQGCLSPFAGLIGEALANVLVAGWQQLSVEADVYRWIDARGVPPILASKLIAIYGHEVIAKLEDNPYRLLAFTSWIQADYLGRASGIAPDDPRRLAAAADAVVYLRLESQHTWTPSDLFAGLLGRQLCSDADVAQAAFEMAIRDRAIIEVESGVQGLGPHSMEIYIAERMAAMVVGDFCSLQMTIRHTPGKAEAMKLIAKFEASSQIALNERQKAAVQLAVMAPLASITGGAGVGKTTVLAAVCALSEALGAQVYLLALSGRAARRIREATGRPAQTIASWIRSVDAGLVPLDTEPTIAVDESSMLDLSTTYRLLRRLKRGCRLLLLGDPGQLPPIGFGLVFHAVVREPAIPQVELTEIMRQAASTGIPQVSRDIREGRVPRLPDYRGLENGVSFIECRQREIVHTILDVVNDLGGVDQCRIVGAVKSGPAGVKTINHAFHELLTPGKSHLHGYAVGEPVIWLRNDYDLGLLNGSLGVVVRADTELAVEWEDEGEKTIDPARLEDMDIAYAITTHKAQGSQFPRAVIPVCRSKILDRTLLYTAVTRAQSQVVLVGDRDAYESAIRNAANPSRRQTAIGTHLALACSTASVKPQQRYVDNPETRSVSGQAHN